MIDTGFKLYKQMFEQIDELQAAAAAAGDGFNFSSVARVNPNILEYR